MSDPVTIIVPSRTKDYLANLVQSLNRTQPGWQLNPHWRFTVLNSAGQIPADYCRFLTEMCRADVIGLPDPFVFARAINQAAKTAPYGSNLLVLNDDAAFVSERPLEAAERLFDLMAFQRYGLVGAQVTKGTVGNPDQSRQVPVGRIEPTGTTVCFVAVLVSRLAWSTVGPMDERFDGYGFEDNDYSARVVQKGMRLGTTSDIRVEHGLGGREFSSTYGRDQDQAGMSNLVKRARDLFLKKWGTDRPLDLMRQPTPPTEQEAAK